MGHTRFGKYNLVAQLGQGGMADVFLAVQSGPAGSRFHKLCVIKRLRQSLADDPDFVAMIAEEARIAARLNHPNVVQTFEVGSVGEDHFISMEYLEGQPLHRIQHRIARRPRGADGSSPDLDRDAQLVMLCDALGGLHAAHELADYDGTPLNVVHRDVTPHNIFVTYAGQAKVVDFGIAKARGRIAETRQGVVKGKVRYMSPEQAAARPVDRRSDVFSAGVILFEILAQRRFWNEHDELAVAQALILRNFNPSPRAVRPEIDERLDAIVCRALAPDPAQRTPTALDFQLELEQFLADTGKLVSARRHVATLVGSLFADRRAEMKAILEKQLATLDDEPSQPAFELVRVSTQSTTSMTPPVMTSGGTAVMRSLPGAAAMKTSSAQDAPSRSSMAVAVPRHDAVGPSRRGRAVILGVSLCIALVGVRFLVASSHRPSTGNAAHTNVAAASSGTGAVPTAAPPTPASAQATVLVKLDASPSDAVIVIDDDAPVAVPFEARMPKDGREHRVRIEAAGHAPRVEVVTFSNDLTAFIALERVESKAVAGSRKPRIPTASHVDDRAPGQIGAPASTGEAKAGSVRERPDGRPAKHDRLNTKLDPTDPW